MKSNSFFSAVIVMVIILMSTTFSTASDKGIKFSEKDIKNRVVEATINENLKEWNLSVVEMQKVKIAKKGKKSIMSGWAYTYAIKADFEMSEYGDNIAIILLTVHVNQNNKYTSIMSTIYFADKKMPKTVAKSKKKLESYKKRI